MRDKFNIWPQIWGDAFRCEKKSISRRAYIFTKRLFHKLPDSTTAKIKNRPQKLNDRTSDFDFGGSPGLSTRRENKNGIRKAKKLAVRGVRLWRRRVNLLRNVFTRGKNGMKKYINETRKGTSCFVRCRGKRCGGSPTNCLKVPECLIISLIYMCEDHRSPNTVVWADYINKR